MAVQRDPDRGLDVSTVLLATVFLAVSLAAYGVLSLVISDDRRVSRRLKDMTNYEIAQTKEAQPMLKSFGERVMAPAAKSVGDATKSALPTTYRDRLSARPRKRADLAGSTPTDSSSRNSSP